MEWQPIETAPKDLRDNVLTAFRYGEIRVCSGAYIRVLIDGARAEGEPCVATHWMPLPKPPK